jgi:uncharacterized delta-60 repeat protein
LIVALCEASLQPPFSVSGMTAVNAVPTQFITEATAVDANGNTLLAGSENGFTTAVLERITPSGIPDASLGDGGVVTAPQGAAAFYAVANDGQEILAAGNDVSLSGDTFALERFNASGAVDTTFASSDQPISGIAYTIAVSPDGNTIAVGGQSGGQFAIALFHADGTPDTTFGDDGVEISGFGTIPTGQDGNIVGNIIVNNDGSVVAVGANGPNVVALRLTPSGDLDPTFNSGGALIVPGLQADQVPGTPDPTEGLAVQGTNILVANHTAGDHFGLVRITSSGLVDNAFANGLAQANFGGSDDADSIIVQPSGQIDVFGTTTSLSGGATLPCAAAFLPGGELDTSFNKSGMATLSLTPTESSSESPAIKPDAVLAGGLQPAHASSTGAGNFVISLGQSSSAGDSTTVVRLITDLIPPTATFASSNVIAAGGTTAAFTVTYNDNNAVATGTIGTANVQVTGPNDIPLTVQSVTIAPGNSIGTATVTYVVDCPTGTWSTANNGTYTVAMLGNVTDEAGNFVAASPSFGMFQVQITSNATGVPIPTFSGGAVTAPSSSTSFSVVYTDSAASLAADSVATGNLSVTRASDGHPLDVTVAGGSLSSDGHTLSATYTVADMSGTFSESSDGVYDVRLLPNQIGDAANTFAAGGLLGTFQVDVATPSTKFGAFGTTSGSKKPQQLTFNTAGGTKVTLSLTGGSGTALQEPGSDRVDLTLNGAGPMKLTVKGDVELGNLVVSGALASFGAPGASLQGTLFATGSIAKLQLGSVSGGVIASEGAISSVTTASFSNALLLSGANLGADDLLGGGDDSFSAGSIGSVTVRGAITDSIFAAGAGPGPDGIFGDSDDTGPGGIIRSVTAKSATGPHFEAAAFGLFKLPARVKKPTQDSRFIVV